MRLRVPLQYLWVDIWSPKPLILELLRFRVSAFRGLGFRVASATYLVSARTVRAKSSATQTAKIQTILAIIVVVYNKDTIVVTNSILILVLVTTS